jgi:hypothetical protein
LSKACSAADTPRLFQVEVAKFAVTFNKYYDYFIIERPDDFHDRVGRHLTADPTRTAGDRWLRGRGR